MPRGRRPLAIDWDAQPLGRVPDTELARALAVHPHTVAAARAARGIAPAPRPPHPKQSRTPRAVWDAQQLGVRGDREIARALGVGHSTVRAERKRRGIPAPPTHAGPLSAAAAALRETSWDHQPLGAIADDRIAETLGVGVRAVRTARIARGIQPPGSRSAVAAIDWDAQPLGAVADAVLAARLGVGGATVAKKRHARGIPAYQAPKLVTKRAPLPRWRRKDAKLDWNAERLGLVSDELIALRLAISPRVVAEQRVGTGMPRPRQPCPECGALLDLATLLGPAMEIVRKARERAAKTPRRARRAKRRGR